MTARTQCGPTSASGVATIATLSQMLELADGAIAAQLAGLTQRLTRARALAKRNLEFEHTRPPAEVVVQHPRKTGLLGD